MIRLRISKRVLRAVALGLLAPALLALLVLVGNNVTPRDGAGRPLLLSPSLRAGVRYQERARAWSAQMLALDRRLAALLEGGADAGAADAGELYAQSLEIQAVGEAAAALAREAAVMEAPVALVGLRNQARLASEGYLAAALATARWLGAPSESSRQAAVETLSMAREQRTQLEESRWLTTSLRSN